MPVTASASWASLWARAPRAMASATGWLTAPWASISGAGTPSWAVLAALL